MRWLITTKANVDLKQLTAKLSTFGCELVNDLPPIPMGDDEQVVEVEASQDLSEMLKTDEEILQLHPSSEMTLY
ncbi:MAG: hypothetical protein QNJ54_01310 [Prochloraceae cyanobacterium]|nr:hypothetical protein [Prochloraceae cyanobacterium]